LDNAVLGRLLRVAFRALLTIEANGGTDDPPAAGGWWSSRLGRKNDLQRDGWGKLLAAFMEGVNPLRDFPVGNHRG
jgi:hypothetical protein